VMLSSLRSRRRARNWARARGGLGAAAAMGDYQLAATELALLHDKAGRGVVSAPRFLDRQRDLLVLMHAARSAFLGRWEGQPRPPWAASGGSGFSGGPPRPAPLPPFAGRE
jgi:protease PrsW